MPDAYPGEITDAIGNVITVDDPNGTWVVLSTDALEALRAVGAGDKVIGVSKYVIENQLLFPEYGDYPNVGSPWSLDLEELVRLSPTYVITYTKYPKPAELEEQLDGTGIKVVRFDFSKLSTYTDEIEKLGYITGNVDNANEFVDFYESVVGMINETLSTLSDEEKLTVYLEVDTGGKPNYWTSGQGHGHNDVLVVAGGKNVFEDVEYYKEVDPEGVIERNPDKIFRYQWPAGAGWDQERTNTTVLEEIRKEVLNRPELKDVSAVVNGEVYIYTRETTQGPAKQFLCLPLMAKWLYPDLFENLEPREIYQKYLEFQGLDLDLGGKGVFALPEP